MKLLFRGKLHHDEDFTDYIARLGFWNGFSFHDFIDALGELFYKKYRYCAEVLNEEYVALLMLEQLLERNIPQNNTRDLRAPWYCPTTAIEFTEDIKICSECWQESRYIRFYWHFSDYMRCHIHDTFLHYPETFSYQSDNSSGLTISVDVEVTESSSCYILMELIKSHVRSDYALELIAREFEEYLFCLELVQLLAEHFSKYMNVNLNSEAALKTLRSGVLIEGTLTRKMDRIYELLLVGNEFLERRVRCIAVIKSRETADHAIYNLKGNARSSEVERWIVTEVLSIDELFYAYIRVYVEFQDIKGFRVSRELSGFEKLDDTVDRNLSLELFCQPLYWPYPAMLDEDILAYRHMIRQEKEGDCSMRYNSFLKMLGHKTIDELEVSVE